MNRNLLIWTSALIGCQIFFAGAGLAEVIGVKPAFVGALLVASLQGATTNYTRGVVVAADEADQRVTEATDRGDQRVDEVEAAIVTRVAEDGTVRAGQASELPTGDVVPVLPDPATGSPVPLAPVHAELVA